MAHTKTEIKKAKNLLNKFALKGEQLAFINSKEAKLLKKMGGAGKMTKAGIRSYAEDEEDQNAMNSSDYSSQDNEEQQSIDAGESTAQMSTASRDAQGYGSGTNINDLSSGNSILSRVGNFIKGAALTTLTASTFGLTTVGAMALNKTVQLASKTAKDRGFNTKQKNTYITKKTTPTGGGGGSNNDNLAFNVGNRIIKLSPTKAEVSQSSATDVTYDERKTKAKGRSMMVKTNSRGIGKNMGSVLGTKSLLGAA